jgi:hypothetical protein
VWKHKPEGLVENHQQWKIINMENVFSTDIIGSGIIIMQHSVSGRRRSITGGWGLIFIHSYSALLISFEINCFQGL